MKLFINGNFHTLTNKKAQAILVNNDGFIEEIFFGKAPTISAEIIDLDQNHILPGFIDTHTHSFEGGLYRLNVNLGSKENLAEIFSAIKEKDTETIFAYNFDETKIAEKRFPTLAELDDISTTQNIIIRRVDGHSCIINSKAKKQLNINFLPNFNGLLTKKKNDIAVHHFHKDLNDKQILLAFKEAENYALKNGLTTIHTMVGDANEDLLYYDFIQKQKFRIDWILYPQILNIEKALSVNKKRIGGCILADGSIGSYTAALKENYTNKNIKGKPYQTDKFWQNFIFKAHKNNLQTAVHAIGDAAIEQIISAIEKAQNFEKKDLRHQIIHCEILSDNMIKRMAKAKISAVMQPMFDRLWGGNNNFYEKKLGSRINQMNRLRSLHDSDILTSGSSDWYVTDLNPRLGIHAAENIHNKSERLSRREAIKLYTKNAAFISFEEKSKGTLEPGKLADMVVLDKNPFTIKDFRKINIIKTIKKGELCKIKS